MLEESRFAGADFRLVDEELAAGTLTEAGGEPALILPVEEGSFDRAKLIFFTGSPEFVERNRKVAAKSQAHVLDFSGRFETEDLPPSPYFPKLDELWGLDPSRNAGRTSSAPEHAWIISANGVAATSLSLGLRGLGLKKLTITFARSVSEAGRAGIDELASQTGQLLSFQSVGQPIFDAQVAFNLLIHYGPASRQKLSAARDSLRTEVSECVQNQGAVMPSIQLIHAPVFYGAIFSACAELDPGFGSEAILAACEKAGFSVLRDAETGPSNLSAIGESTVQIGVPERDPTQCGTWWFWGAADNIRLPAWNAVKLAEKLVP